MPLLTLMQLESEGGISKAIGRLSYDVGNSFADFRNQLDGLQMFDFAFDFWDTFLGSRMLRPLERGNLLVDYDSQVTVISCKQSQSPRIQLLQSNNIEELCNEEVEVVSVIISPPPIGSFNGSNDPCELTPPSIENISVSILEPTCDMVDGPSSHDNMLSTLIDKSMLDIWKRGIVKLEVYMEELNLSNHRWRVHTWDEENEVHARLECLECDVYINGFSKGVMDKLSITNSFANFKNKHLKSKKHHSNWCRRRKLPVIEEEVRARVKASVLDDRAQVNLGVKIMNRINEEQGSDVTFQLLGDLDRPDPFYAFYYRVKCTFCGDSMQLVPQQKKLEHNLREHLGSPKHEASVQLDKKRGRGVALLTGRPGRPTLSDSRDTRQKTIHRFFGSDQGKSSKSASSGAGIDVDEGLSQLCWGLWREFVQCSGIERGVKDILDDQRRGVLWFCEPDVNVKVLDLNSGLIHAIAGLFRHERYSRVSRGGGGFRDLTCQFCSSIKLQTDFRLRVHRESISNVKRGLRDTGKGRRLDYLTKMELANQSRNYSRNLASTRRRIRRLASQICMLRSKVPSLRKVLGDAIDCDDMFKFCSSVVSAHKRGPFGGKSALWDLLKDVVLNLNRKPNAKRYSTGTKVICQALLQHGGRRVVDCLSMNMLGPSLDTLQRHRRGFVYFRVGLYEAQFMLIAQVYTKLKEKLCISGAIPCIIAEDETTVKQSVRWMVKTDTLVGFCGLKEDHQCEVGLEIKVGSGEQGFQNIMESFQNHHIGNNVRVMMVNPLHADFPRLCLMATSTCHRFDANWVRTQWDLVSSMWDKYCRELVGPLLGHASDGDQRRRKLMLQDYCGKGVHIQRECIGWEGWVFSHSLVQRSGGVVDPYGLHDQDFIHNAKKLINPLSCISKTVKLGVGVALHEHIVQVYETMGVEQHGLNADDIARTDRQNWSSAQRLCSRKVILSLQALQKRKDARSELCLGTEKYLEMCADYIDIFYNVRLTLRERIVLCSKVSFFLRLWRLWLEKGNHYVGGNKQVLGLSNMPSIQTFYDVQMSCHFVVLLIVVFRDSYPSLPVPLHLTGSDSCEQFFSKVGGMKGHERNYDLCELIECSTALNRLAELDQYDGVMSVGKTHKKHKNIWMKIHPLLNGEVAATMNDYTGLISNEDVIAALKKGFAMAQNMAITLQMCPSTSARDQAWFKEPWLVERNGVFKNCLDTLQAAEVEDDEQPLIEGLNTEVEEPEADRQGLSIEVENPSIMEVDDGIDDTSFIHSEFQHSISELIAELEQEPIRMNERVEPTVCFEGRILYKSTLVSQLVGNPSLSKDRLTKVKQSTYFNNLIDKPKIRAGMTTMFIMPGSDCDVNFVEPLTSRLTRAIAPKGQKKKDARPIGVAISASNMGSCDKNMWYLGRVQRIRKKYGNNWGRCREPIDLLNRPVSRPGTDGSCCEVLFNWFSKTSSRFNFKYTDVDPQWIDLDAVISVVSLSISPSSPTIYRLDVNDAKSLDDFVKNCS